MSNDVYLFPAATNPNDVILRSGISPSLTYGIDIAFKKYENTDLYYVDVSLKKPDIIVPKSIDVIFKKLGIPITDMMDVIFKKYDVLKTDTMDTIFKKLGLSTSSLIDVIFALYITLNSKYDSFVEIEKLYPTSNIKLDALSEIIKLYLTVNTKYDVVSEITKLYPTINKKFDSLTQSDLSIIFHLLYYTIDSILMKFDASISHIIDTLIVLVGRNAYSIDMIEARLGLSKPYSFDTLFKKLDALKTYNVDASLIQRANQISYLLDIILASALAALGGGQPTGRIEITVKYIDHNYEYEIGPLDLIKKAPEKIIQIEGLNIKFNKTKQEFLYSKLSTVREFQTFMLVKPLNVIGKHSQDFPVSELKIIIFSKSYVEVQPFDVFISAGNKSIDYSPLDTTNEVKFYVPVSGLDVVKESIHQISISPLIMRDKSKKQKEIMDLFDALDEMD
jgi:hypothetical protein